MKFRASGRHAIKMVAANCVFSEGTSRSVKMGFVAKVIDKIRIVPRSF